MRPFIIDVVDGDRSAHGSAGAWRVGCLGSLKQVQKGS